MSLMGYLERRTAQMSNGWDAHFRALEQQALRAQQEQDRRLQVITDARAGVAPANATDKEIADGKTAAARVYHKLEHRKRNNEMARVLDMPAVSYDNVEDLTDSLLKDPTKRLWADGREARLRLVQNKMLTAARDANGGYFMASTGAGKSYAAILVGSVMKDVNRALIFTPASTVSNLQAEYFRLRNLFKVLPIQTHLQIRSMEELSKAREEHQGDLLEELVMRNGGDPSKTVLVFDEAHRLKNLTSARGGRVMRTMLKLPELRVVVMSGTMTARSVTEAAHLAWYALRDGSPYPVRYGGGQGSHEGHRLLQLEALAACTDVDGQPTHHDWAEVAPLILKYFPEHTDNLMSVPGPQRTSMARLAFQKRLLTTAGVVLTTESEIKGLALHLEGVTLAVPEVIRNAIAQIEGGTDLNDMPIPDASQTARIRKQLAQGFYYVWDWPKDHHGVPIVDLKWKGARSQWAKMVRTEIQTSARLGYDSEMLVYNSVKRQVLALCGTDTERAWVEHIARTAKDNKTWEGFAEPGQALDIWRRLRGRAARSFLCEAWLDWSAVEKHKPEPPVQGVWLSTFLLEHAIALAKTLPESPILWYEHREVGAKLQQLGVPAYGQGTDPPKNGGLCALSLGVHSEGKNLQDRWHSQIYLCPMSSGPRWEQNLGRTYREGQELRHPIVRGLIYQHDESFVDAINTARSMAAYAEDQGNKQKLLFAKYKDIKLFKITYGADFATAVDSNVDAA